MSDESSECTNGETSTVPEQINEKRIGCAHYKRRAKFVTPCCNKVYMCRYCHDENENHYINRKLVTELMCTECDTRQTVQAECQNCGVRFGKYTCLICNLFDDENKKQYHCDGCGICRVGGRDRFFHCERCNMCLPVQLQRVGHRCVENVSRANCPVCLEDIHTSRIPCHIPDCGHLLHRPCFEQMLKSGHYACPTCQTSMIDMTNLWNYLDSEVAATPMPPEYADYKTTILCKDCHKLPFWSKELAEMKKMVARKKRRIRVAAPIRRQLVVNRYSKEKEKYIKALKEAHEKRWEEFFEDKGLSTVKFHVVGLKCQHCGGYNTCQTNGFHKDSGSSNQCNSSPSASTASRSGSSSASFEPRTDTEDGDPGLPRPGPLDEPPQA